MVPGRQSGVINWPRQGKTGIHQLHSAGRGFKCLIKIISSLIWFQERNWVTVEGLNVEYEKMGETKEFPGMMIKKELPLIVNRDISLVDPSTEEAGEVEWRFDEAGIEVLTQRR